MDPGEYAYAPSSQGQPSLRLTLDMPSKQVRLLGSSASPRLSASQEIAVNFWPTAIAGGSAHEIYIAGIDDRGFALLERWTFTSAPLVQSQLNPGTDQLEQSLQLPAIQSKTVVFMQARGLQGAIAEVAHNRVNAEIYILFDDSALLGRINPSTGQVSINGSPTIPAPAGALHIPWLTEVDEGLTVRTHSVHGEVFIGRSAEFDTTTRVAIDADLSGTLDSQKIMTTAQWGASGLADLEQYVPY